MNKKEIIKLKKDLTCMIRSGATTEEVEEWADAYYFSRKDLIDVIRLMLKQKIRR